VDAVKIITDFIAQRPNLFDNREPVIKKIILHDPGNNQTYSQLRRWFETTSRYGCYHDIIEGDTVYQIVPYNKRAFHAGTFDFSEFWPEMGTLGFQNNNSLGVCGIRNHNSWEVGARHIANLLTQYDLMPKDVLCHYHLTKSKTDPIELRGEFYSTFLDEVTHYWTEFNR